MTPEFIGMIQQRPQSETHPADPAVVLDRDFIRDFARAHEASGFDRILIGYYADAPDGFGVATWAAAHTERLGLLLAHRPGFVAPTLAARQFATLDQLSGGRAAIHVVSGGDDADQARDGDYLGKEERYARTAEYVAILKRLWTAEAPVSHAGRFYRFDGGSPAVRTVQRPRIPVYFGGASEAAVRVAGEHADVFALWGETRAQVAEIVARVRAEAARHGREIRFSLSLRPILAETEERAWERAAEILATVRRVRGQAWLGAGPRSPAGGPANEGSRRLLEAAAQGERLDERLWTAVAQATGARGNTTALVGTPAQVADSLAQYWDLGVTTFLIRGFDPLEDAIEYGRELLPMTRELIARRRRRGGGRAAA